MQNMGRARDMYETIIIFKALDYVCSLISCCKNSYCRLIQLDSPLCTKLNNVLHYFGVSVFTVQMGYVNLPLNHCPLLPLLHIP